MAKRVIAIIGIVFMVIFSVSIVFVFVDPKMLNGLFGYMALLSAIAGAACFVVVKYVFNEDKGYLPKEGGEKKEAKDGEKAEEGNETESAENAESTKEPAPENAESAKETAPENTAEEK